MRKCTRDGFIKKNKNQKQKLKGTSILHFYYFIGTFQSYGCGDYIKSILQIYNYNYIDISIHNVYTLFNLMPVSGNFCLLLVVSSSKKVVYFQITRQNLRPLNILKLLVYCNPLDFARNSNQIYEINTDSSLIFFERDLTAQYIIHFGSFQIQPSLITKCVKLPLPTIRQ